MVNSFGTRFADIFAIIIVLTAVITFVKFNKNKMIKENISGLKKFNDNLESIKEEEEFSSRILMIKSEKLLGEDENNQLYNMLDDYIRYYERTDNIPKAEEFFTRNKIINEPSVRGLANIVPSILTSLGVLGTFLGLQEGTASLDVASVEVIEESIQGLMENMSLAFITSIFGISTSVLWLFFDRKLYNINLQLYNDFIENMNKLTVQTSRDAILLKVLESNKEMETSIKGMATDMSLQISKSFEDVVESKLLPGLEDSISKGFGSSVSGMSDEIQERTNETITEQLSKVGSIVNVLKDEVEDLKENEFKELRYTLEEFNNTNEDLSINFKNINKDIKETAVYYENINNTGKERMETYNKASENILEVSNNMVDNISSLEKLSSDLQNISISNSDVLKTVESMSSKMVNIEEDFTNNLEVFSNNIELLEESLNITRENITKSLEENTINMEEILKENQFEFGEDLKGSLNKTFQVFDTQLSQIYGSLNGTILNLENIIKKLPVQVTSIYNEMNDHTIKMSEILEESIELHENISKEKR